jgi:cellulose synthase/poly-beta-1,6-N-acetylglucosamine synthase-like glycosyltransferase
LDRSVAVGVSIFGVLALVVLLMRSTFTFSVVAIGLVLSGYLLLASRHPRTSRTAGRHIPSVLSLIGLSLPFVLPAFLMWEGYVGWNSIILGVVAYGLFATFWTNTMSIPLALKSKLGETNSSLSNHYPTVSIIVPAYNEAKVIAKTVESLLEAEYPHKEIILVDDGSTDGTFEEASKFDGRIKILRKENGGKYSALNYGARFATGEILIVVDADTIIGRTSLLEISKKFSDKSVVAVAGNIKVLNRNSWLTKCQALEYIISIQTFRRALDSFGTVTVVPGALGAFRKRILEETGFYDKETLTEDFDVTVKALKTGFVVQGSSMALAYTQSPQTLGDLYNQRMRWYRGNFQTLWRHIDALTNPRFGFLHRLGYPFMLLSMLFLPIAGLVVWGSVFIAIVQNQSLFILEALVLFVVIQCLLAFLSIMIDGEDVRLVAYAPFFVIGYKQLVDLLIVKALVDVLFGRRMSWTRARRYTLPIRH